MSQAKAMEATGQSPMCRHHWVIETPNGAVSTGHCKRCGIDRDFRNSTEDQTWDADSFSLSGSRYRGRKGAKAPDQLS